MRNFVLILAFTALAFLVTGQSGTSQMRGGMHGMKKGKTQARSMQGLDLSTDQLQKINRLRLDYFQETSELRVKLMEKREQLSLLVYADKYDEDKVNRTVDQLADLEAELTKKELKLSRDIRSVLTPEQRARWDASGGPMGMGHGMGMCGLGSGMMGGQGRGSGRGMMMGPGMMGPGRRGYSPPEDQ